MSNFSLNPVSTFFNSLSSTRKVALLVGFVLAASWHLAFAVPERVNINTAGVDELAAMLIGVGESRAQAIVEHREAHGDFVSIEDLVAVSGIGNKVLEDNRERMAVSD